MSKLEELNLENCAEIDSLAPLAKCASLETLRLIGDTKMADGNIEPLLSMPALRNVSLRDWNHYNLTSEEVNKALALNS
jgi:hypothetical protein